MAKGERLPVEPQVALGKLIETLAYFHLKSQSAIKVRRGSLGCAKIRAITSLANVGLGFAKTCCFDSGLFLFRDRMP